MTGHSDLRAVADQAQFLWNVLRGDARQNPSLFAPISHAEWATVSMRASAVDDRGLVKVAQVYHAPMDAFQYQFFWIDEGQ